ncbi:branched-chain amino acid ABC transporter permease [uncultured Castellaniella sp.]|uniref:branched-chain amino acid ABC transporter permease n=1 Tax=uncultured Castellaniella sp. TaxID=647907 RepID=UPI0026092C31|nr:branched-chain amino acid ABC transporter permease [uncultured Castellaniella sp.]
MTTMTSQRRSRIAPIALAALALALAASQFIRSEIALSLLTQAAVYAVFATGLGVLLRQNGMVSFGHAAFFGLSGYIVAILLQDTGISAEAAILISLAGIAAFALLLGFVIVRIPGIAFAMLTLALGQLFYQVALQSRALTGGADGISINWPDTLFGIPLGTLLEPATLFMTTWTVLILSIALLTWLQRSRFGRTTEAIRDNPERAMFIGIRPMAPRVLIFTLSAVLTGLAGVLAALNTGFISPESMHWSVSGTALMMVVVGGYWRISGPALGAIVFIVAKDLIGDFSTHWLSLFGLVLIIAVVFTDNGLSGALQNLIDRLRRPRSAERHATTH